MKHMTRILALLLALVLCLGLSVTAFAAEEKGSITINSAVKDQTYTIYRILELYGCTGEPNEGVRWTPDEQFRRVGQSMAAASLPTTSLPEV